MPLPKVGNMDQDSVQRLTDAIRADPMLRDEAIELP